MADAPADRTARRRVVHRFEFGPGEEAGDPQRFDPEERAQRPREDRSGRERPERGHPADRRRDQERPRDAQEERPRLRQRDHHAERPRDHQAERLRDHQSEPSRPPHGGEADRFAGRPPAPRDGADLRARVLRGDSDDRARQGDDRARGSYRSELDRRIRKIQRERMEAQQRRAERLGEPGPGISGLDREAAFDPDEPRGGGPRGGERRGDSWAGAPGGIRRPPDNRSGDRRSWDRGRAPASGARPVEPGRGGRPMNRAGMIGRVRSAEGRGGRGGRERKRDLLEGLRMLHRGVSIDPYERLVLETVKDNYSTRVIDLIAPVGRGQRCLVTSPPKAGKTMLLMAMAQAIITNHPDVQVVVLLVDERPEEVTFFRRGVACEVVASSNDMTPDDHVRTAEETVLRVAENVMAGQDVVLFLDSITRLARAYNVFADGSGRTLSGGLDASTMYGPRRIFGAARKIENGGSLTIVGTALVDTGSRMDEVIFQEFKGTGNTEIMLSRDLANKRIYPSVDLLLSGSRKEEKLYTVDVVSRIHILRRFLADRKPDEAMLGLIKMMERYPTNRELLRALA